MNHVGVGVTADEITDALEDRARRIVGCGALLVNDEAARPQVDEISERAPGVDAEA
jgi:hypothetical protein